MKVSAQTAVQPNLATAAVATSSLPAQYRQWMPFVNEAAQKYHLDPALILGVMSRESNGHNVRGDGGHGRGLMQIDDRSWGSWLASHNGGMDPRTNILKGAEILRDNINYFHGNVRDGVAAYNCGAGNVKSALARGLSPDAYTTGHNYSADVLARTANFKKELGGSQPPPPKPPPSSGYTAPSQNLTLGDHNSAVQQLQKDLVHLGYMKQSDMNTGPGIFGPHTEAALKKFQESHGIHGDGGQHYGPATRAALQKALAPHVAPKPPPAPKPPAPKPPAPKPPAAKYTAPSQNLALGDHNAAVKQLQTDLVHLGYMKQSDMNTGPGIFGPHTEAALKKFQESHGIHGDNGQHYGPTTRAALQKALAPTPQPKPPAPKPPAPKPPAPKPPSGSYTAPAQNLKVGDHNAAVQQLQKDLVHLGFMKQSDMNTGPGIYGPHTQSAVADFQAKWGIFGDGGKDYGPATRAALEKALKGGKPPPPPKPSGSSAAYNNAVSVLGRNISDLKYNGPLAPYLDKWPGNNVCCANFVSACLEKAGQINHSEHNDTVRYLDANLEKDPRWSRTSLANAKPGDVVSFNVPGEGPESHVVMFAGWKNGKPQFIGSNNVNADGSQRITQEYMSYPIHAIYHFHG